MQMFVDFVATTTRNAFVLGGAACKVHRHEAHPNKRLECHVCLLYHFILKPLFNLCQSIIKKLKSFKQSDRSYIIVVYLDMVSMLNLKNGVLAEDDDFLLVTNEPSSQPTESATHIPTYILTSNFTSLNSVNETITPSISPTTVELSSDVPTTIVVMNDTSTTSIPTSIPTPIPTTAATPVPSYSPSASPSFTNTSAPTIMVLPSSFPTQTPTSELPISVIIPSMAPSIMPQYSSNPTSTVSVHNTSTIASVSASGTPYFTNNNIIVVACLSLALFLCCLTVGLGFMRYRRSNLRSARQMKSSDVERGGQSGTRLQFSEYLGEEEPDSDGARSTTQLMANSSPHPAGQKGGRVTKIKTGPVTNNPMSTQLTNEQEFYC
jgi:hypothetical protein